MKKLALKKVAVFLPALKKGFQAEGAESFRTKQVFLCAGYRTVFMMEQHGAEAALKPGGR